MKSLLGGVSLVLHHRIVELRKSKRITQEVLSKKIEVTRSALSQYELGSRQPDYGIIKRMADYFDVSIDYLLGRDVTEESSIEETEADLKRKKGLEYISKIKDEKMLDLAIELLEKLARE